MNLNGYFKKDDSSEYLSKVGTLLKILGNLKLPNKLIVLKCFIEAVKVICSRQNTLNKNQLKMKEVRSALNLITFHYEKTSTIKASTVPLNDLLGKNLNEGDALKYYEKNVEGEIKDFYGRKINLPFDGFRHLYKDREGKHVTDTEFFQSYRGKRLPWIRHALINTKEIYKKREWKWIVYAYVKCFRVPTHDGFVSNYLFVIVKAENPQVPLKFITAYHFNDHEILLKRIEDFEPYCGPIKH